MICPRVWGSGEIDIQLTSIIDIPAPVENALAMLGRSFLNVARRIEA